MREYNELSHFFQRRLNLSHGPAQRYSECFPSLAMGMIAQCIAFVAGAVIAVLLLLTFANSSVLTNITVLDRTLLWHLAASSLVLAIVRTFVPQSRGFNNHSPVDIPAQPCVSYSGSDALSKPHVLNACVARRAAAPSGTPQEHLNETFRHTHYMPPRWRSNAKLIQVYHEFSCLYMDRTQLFVGSVALFNEMRVCVPCCVGV